MNDSAAVQDPGSARGHALLLAALTALTLLPFAGKAFHIDDTLFLKAAAQIRTDPLDFYGFSVNWYGTEEPMSEVTKNPPLASYFLALASAIGGWKELSLHLAFVVPAVAAILGTYALATRLCAHPFAASLATLLTPAFLVSSTNVMCDTMLLAFWVWAIELWMRGLDERRSALLAASSVLVALAALSKYFGISLIPLLAVFSVMRAPDTAQFASAHGGSGDAHRFRGLLFLLFPAAVLAAYQLATDAMYGRGLLTDAASYAEDARQTTRTLFIGRGTVGLAFAGASIAAAAFFIPRLWTRRERTLGVAIALLAMLVVLGQSNPGGPGLLDGSGQIRWTLAAQFALWTLGGVSLLALALADFLACRDRESTFLLLWSGGTIFFAAFVNWAINARSFLPLAPAAGILVMRRLERKLIISNPREAFGRLGPPLVFASVLALLVTTADYRLAANGRTAARRIAAEAERSSGILWFQGHWGFQYYMEAAGAKPLDHRRSRLSVGDRIAIPVNNTNLFRLPGDAVTQRPAFDLPVFPFLAALSPKVGAGFYLNAWGPLPFAFGRVPQEHYVLLDVFHDLPAGAIGR